MANYCVIVEMEPRRFDVISGDVADVVRAAIGKYPNKYSNRSFLLVEGEMGRTPEQFRVSIGDIIIGLNSSAGPEYPIGWADVQTALRDSGYRSITSGTATKAIAESIDSLITTLK